MDDSEHLCPLCCEELDLSDREFYPCKCGYQVCMWCWHRIRETESGLCPACRTPYGEDPHQFTAVDVGKVLKANKEKEAAAKRDRQQRNSHHQNLAGQQSDHSPTDEHHFPGIGEISTEAAKDRALLANMRVIRRNLVYAVGLPPGIGTEELLRKPEYFGQYGRIAKIVVNRTQVTSGDPRRSTASAYVTFVHKEDTLACILALDGYHMDGRNIRASYGTSKYCSAFIKNVRCNNPDCTYLHEMGANEDTFTKQEIQAGYVTSGRDVLARQQQIVAEQLRQTGSSVSGPRKRIGGGGPSGTGRASSHPVFPAPEFDEQSKPNPTLVPPPPPAMARAVTTTSSAPPAVATRPVSRAASVGSKSPGSGPTPVSAAAAAAITVASLPPQRKPVSAASVVAGMHTTRAEAPEPHTQLTPLTPLKRTSTKAARASTTGDLPEKLTPARPTAAGKKKNGVVSSNTSAVAAAPAPAPAAAPLAVPVAAAGAVGPSSELSGTSAAKPGSASIGGDPIGPPAPVRNSAVSSLGGDPVGPEPAPSSVPGHSSLLGGDVFTGQLHTSSRSAIGSGKLANSGLVAAGESVPVAPPSTNSQLWGGVGSPNGQSLAPGPPGAPGGSVIGSRAPGPGTIGNSSSALASILGVSLPTGSGSLKESSSMWSSAPGPVAVTPSPLSSLNSGSVPVQGSVIGGAPVGMGGGSSLIGGVPIGGGSSFDSSTNGTIGGGNGGSGNTKSDIALLQSLLPGVHITSGSEAPGFGAVGGWNGRSGPSSLNGDAVVGSGNNNWGSVAPEQGPSVAVGTIGGSAIQQRNQRGPGIW